MSTASPDGAGSATEIFADEVGNASYSNGVVRIDLVSEAPSLDGDGTVRPTMEFRQRVVMPAEGFLRSLGTMQELMSKLLDAGIVKQNHTDKSEESVKKKVDTPPPNPKSKPPVVASTLEPAHSPNFT